ncbi:MAG TPA: hypothetical protein VHZ76_10595 [Gammaproteobacteria bacterium]|jgi:hypothetical protein|nr:hypothetical protein [Gammaproteobacteria bacterium]
MIDQPTHKLTDEEFLEAYVECRCKCSKTARYITERYGLYYTRQSVHERAKKFPGAKMQLLLLDADQCDTNLIGFADDEKNDIRLRVRLYLHLQNTIYKCFDARTNYYAILKNTIS